MANSYVPTDETAADLALDRTNFIGAVLGGCAWGVHAVVAAMCFYNLRRETSSSGLRKTLTLACIFILFVMGTLNLTGNTAISTEMFVNNRMFPGGPSAYLTANYEAPSNEMGNAAYFVSNFFADGIMLYRTFVVWNRNYLIMAIPFLLYLGSTSLSILAMYEISQPTASLWTHTSVNVMLTYFSVAMTLNVVLTSLIAGRLLSMSSQVKKALGPRYARTYTSVAAMVVESALPYSALGLAFIGTYATNNPAQNVLLPILSQVMCISPEMIIWRVAMGRAWSENTTGVAYHGRRGETSVALAELKFKSSGAAFSSQGNATRVNPESQASFDQSKATFGEGV